MIDREHGIVLRQYPHHPHKFSVITQTLGKITLVVRNKYVLDRINPGSVIEFHHTEQNQMVHLVQNCSVIFTPLPTTNLDLIWLHHILELSYYFVPLHQQTKEMFTALATCIFVFRERDLVADEEWELVKRLCIATILLLVGFFPPDELAKPVLIIKNTLLSFIDIDHESKVDFLKYCIRTYCSVKHSTLDTWLLDCIQSHPQVHAFRTLTFMYKTTVIRP